MQNRYLLKTLQYALEESIKISSRTTRQDPEIATPEEEAFGKRIDDLRRRCFDAEDISPRDIELAVIEGNRRGVNRVEEERAGMFLEA